MFPLLESIKILDGMPQNLAYHQYRFEASYFKMFKKLTKIKLANLIEVPEENQKGIVKLRFLYNQNNCFCQYMTYKPKEIQKLKLIFKDNIRYPLKLTDRRLLGQLRLQKGPADDILIVKQQRITDTSFTNIVLFDGQTWWTPQYPLLHGTARSRLMDEKKIKAADILYTDLSSFKSFKLINALLDFEEVKAYPVSHILL